MNKYYRRKQTGFIETILITLAKGLWFLVSWPFRKVLRIKNKELRIDKIENHRKWLEIEKLLQSGDEIHAKQAVIDADKFFYSIMCQLKSNGEKFADRLRNLEDHFDHDIYQRVWEAHKTRNQISHEMDYKISSYEAKNVVEKFRKGLVNLGVL